MTPDGMFDSNKTMALRGLTPRRYILPIFDYKKLDSVSMGNDLVMEQTCSDNPIVRATAVVTEKLSHEIVIHVTPQLLHTEWLELPQINPLYNGRNYQFIYGLSGPPTCSNAPLAFQVGFNFVFTIYLLIIYYCLNSNCLWINDDNINRFPIWTLSLVNG